MGDAETYFKRGIGLAQQGKYGEAAASFQEGLRLKPDSAAAHNDLGNIFVLQRRLPDAVHSFREAVRWKPDFAFAYSNLGNVLRELGNLDEAAANLHKAVLLHPDFVDGHLNLGLALQGQGKLEEAVASCQQALRLKPDHVDAFCHLGMARWKQEKFDEALELYQHALRLEPNHAVTLNSLGAALRELGELGVAEASKPDYADALGNLGIVLWHQARLDEAVANFRAALRIRPDAADIHSNLILTLNYHPGYDARAIQEECSRWNQQHAEPLKELIQPHNNRANPERRLRIGYVSPDFRDHIDSLFITPLLSHHDHRQYEIFAYANVPRPDAVTQRLQVHMDMWRNTVGLSGQQVADLVRSDQIDILVDLELHVANNQLLVFARKPAPVQVAWLGYPGTTGLSTIDYRLTDPYLDPPGLFDEFYSEESVRLPDTFWCYDPLSEEPTINDLPALKTGIFTFGCLNNFCKVNEECLALWAEVLRKVPQSRLLLLLRAPRGHAQDCVIATFQKEGIALSRIELVDSLPRPQYLRLYNRIDLGLDPLPYNGHTTSLDAFWMGVPTLTLLGTRVVGRAGYGQLFNLGLSELAVQTPEQYLELAARWAGDLDRLQELRGSLRERMRHSPLMNGKRFAQHVEQAYRQMWRRWCEQRPPAESVS